MIQFATSTNNLLAAIYFQLWAMTGLLVLIYWRK